MEVLICEPSYTASVYQRYKDFLSIQPHLGAIVHGMLASSLFGTLFGRTIAGAIYVSQNLNFKRPIPVGAEVIARMEIINMENRRKGTLVTCATTCRLAEGEGLIAIEGEAKVLLM